MKQLQASEVPLSKVFSSDFDFKIPDYQRPYAWGVEEAGQLLEDLSDALGRDEDEPYFLGSVVLVKDPSGPAADIIDGQQRITTVTDLLAVLRDLAADGGIRASLAAKIIEPGDPVMGLTPKPRLSLRERDRAFFRQFVQEPGQIDVLRAVKDDGLHTESQRNIRDNARTFHATLGFWEDNRRDQLATMLMTRTFLVTVTTPDLDNAHRIFSVMNSRGLDLSPTDIFKAQVIGAIGPLPHQSRGHRRRLSDPHQSGRAGPRPLRHHCPPHPRRARGPRRADGTLDGRLGRPHRPRSPLVGLRPVDPAPRCSATWLATSPA